MLNYLPDWVSSLLILAIAGLLFSCGLLEEVDPNEQKTPNREFITLIFDPNETFTCGDLVRKEGVRIGITSAEDLACEVALAASCQALAADSLGRLPLAKGTFLKLDFTTMNTRGVSVNYYGSEFLGDCAGSGCMKIRAYDQDGALIDSALYDPITIPGMSRYVGDEPAFPDIAYLLIPGCKNTIGQIYVAVFR